MRLKYPPFNFRLIMKFPLDAAFPCFSQSRDRLSASNAGMPWRSCLERSGNWTAFAAYGKHPCTKPGHRPVNGLHSIENTSTYKARFFVDEKNRKCRTESFFDGFQVFPVGAASGAQAKIARESPQGMEREQVEQGSNASYWPRRMDSTPPRNSYFWVSSYEF